MVTHPSPSICAAAANPLDDVLGKDAVAVLFLLQGDRDPRRGRHEVRAPPSRGQPQLVVEIPASERGAHGAAEAAVQHERHLAAGRYVDVVADALDRNRGGLERVDRRVERREVKPAGQIKLPCPE